MAAAVKEKPMRDDEPRKAPSIEDLERELAPKMVMPDEPEAVEEARQVGKLEVVLLTSLAWLALFGVFILLVLFDPTESKVIRGTMREILDPDEEIMERRHEDELLAIQEEEWRLLLWEAELDQREERLTDQEDRLADREAELEDLLLEYQELIEEIRSMLGSGSGGGGGGRDPQAEVAAMAKTIERMEPITAARTLEEMDFEGAVKICALISAKRLAPIMNVMDEEFRAELANALIAQAEEDDDWGWLLDPDIGF
jgi:flagellar motility protein MotE (MotC chaperone)